jgi:hypothetical protein
MAENYEGMKRLHFLLLKGVNVEGDFSNWSQELSWLQWINSDLSTLPSKLKLQKLAVLDLTSNKKLKQIWPNDLEVLILNMHRNAPIKVMLHIYFNFEYVKFIEYQTNKPHDGAFVFNAL